MSTNGTEDHETPEAADAGAVDEVETTLVTLAFDAVDMEALTAVLSKYVVLTRQQDGCRNVDLCLSVTRPDRIVIIQKWESPAAQQRHFDSKEMVEMATACTGLLKDAPLIDLLEGLSAHDLN